MTDTGYVKLWRKSIESAVFTDPILWKLWCLCLMKANYKRRYVQIEGIAEPVEILPGQFITGRFALHKEMYPRKKKNQKSPSTVWNKLQILQNMRNLNIRSHAKYSIITILNWEAYQQNEQQANNRLTTGEQPANTDKKDKKEKKVKKKHAYSAEFEEVWQVYPNTDGKFKAFKQWSTMNGERPNNKALIDAINSQIPKWAKKDFEYVPLFTTWLNQRRWEDGGMKKTQPTMFDEPEEFL